MKKVKGVNIWPQAVDTVMFAEQHVDEYQVHLRSGDTGADIAIMRVMPKTALSAGEAEAWTAAMVEKLKARIGISFNIELVDAGAIERSEYKAKRWLDGRLHAQR